MSDEPRPPTTAQRQREHADPDEGTRPLPWILTMLLGAMAMWGAFYIYSTPSGEDSAYGDQRTVADLRPPVAAAGGAAAPDGKQLFGSKCAACHQASGQGVPGVFPPLAGSEWVLGDEKVLTHILLHGVSGELEVKGTVYKGAMPAWKAMSDAELAAVMSHIRSDWGNKAPEVSAATVKAQREATQSRSEPYKGGQELKAGP
jgi:mono/diheme cytochrome c family protein